MVDLKSSFTLPSGRVLPNRIAKSAMSERLAAKDGVPNQGHLELYRRWGAGGAALLITGNVMVDARAIGESGNVILEAGADLDPFRAWAKAARHEGAQVWMQINHPGRQSPRHLSRVPVAPSAICLKGAGGMFATPRALEPDEIEDIIERFATTAMLAEQAGFDGVQIHGAHGYLISQFLSPYTNRRTDAWGGTPAKRRRFLLEIVSAIRSRVSPRFAVGLKLNSADFQRGGFSEEESTAVIAELDALGLDLLEISGGTYETAAMFDEPHQRESTQKREAYFLEYAERVRATVRTPLMVTGGFRTAAGMTRALESGAVDVVGMARPLAVEPDLPARLCADPTAAARPVRLAIGFKTIDSLVQGAWYQVQIERLARGLEPDPHTSRILAALKYFFPRYAFDPIRPATVTQPLHAPL